MFFFILGQTETRQYNTLGQLTRIQGAGINIEYQFSATANDGKITGQKNWATGEEVTYQYDALERLISAATAASTGSSAWGLSWSYDGFGNRLNQNVTKGTAPTMATLVDANTNRLNGFGYSYDGNGNLLTMPQQSASMTYDGSNRMVKFTNQNDTESYQYAPDNKRVWRSKGCSYQSVVDGSTQVAPTLTFYSVFGQKLGDYCYPPGGGQVVEENVHFGGRIVAKGDAGGALAALATDRLHSKGDGSTFFPYGETKSGTAITGDSFATYSRDWTGLDYADQRWYAPGVGRFTTVDPLPSSFGPNSPQSANRFSYVEADPSNLIDPEGLTGRDSGEDQRDGRIREESCLHFGGYFCLSPVGGGGIGGATPTDPQSVAQMYGIIGAGQELTAANVDWNLLFNGLIVFEQAYPFIGQSDHAFLQILNVLGGGSISTTIDSATWSTINQVAPTIVIGGGIILGEIIDVFGATVTITIAIETIREFFKRKNRNYSWELTCHIHRIGGENHEADVRLKTTIQASSYAEAQSRARFECNILGFSTYGSSGWHVQHWNIRGPL